jgi:hypothetical protein
MGDFWGIEKIKPELDDDKGCGLVLDYVNYNYYLCSSIGKKMTYQQVLKDNAAICNSVNKPKLRNLSFNRMERKRSVECVWTGINSFVRIYYKLRKMLRI